MQPKSNNKKIPLSRWFKQHKFISYSSEGWKIQDQGAGKFDFWWKVSSWLREDSFLLSNMHLRLLHVFSRLTAHFILVLNNVLLSDCTKRTVFSFFVCVFLCVRVSFLTRTVIQSDQGPDFCFCWSIVDLWSCVNFCCTTKWFSYTYIYYILFLIFFSMVIYHRILNIVPWSIQ